MSKTRWLCESNHTPERQDVLAVSQKWNVTETFAELLLRKNLSNLEDFISPTENCLHDPFLFNGMDIAVERLIQAINNHEKITVFGDYDADGITATTIILTYFRTLSYDNIFYHIPQREDGYGLNGSAIKQLAETGTQLLITVDCGITSYKEVELANSLGMDVIVTDHHEQEGNIPPAVAVINPKRIDSNYPYNGLCGAGVAYKFMLALHSKIGENVDFSSDLHEFYDFVAFATVADVVPLTDENRFLVQKGLQYMSSTHENVRPVFKRLLEVAGIDGVITSTNIGFNLGPRINAVGRISDPNIALEYFNFTPENQLYEKATLLNDFNSKRQQIQHEITEEVLNGISSPDEYKKFTVVLAGDNIPSGIKGVVAGDICRDYNRPTIILSESADGEYWEGSARNSSDKFSLKDIFSECSSLLVKFGGHKKAGGLTIKKGDLEDFEDMFEEHVRKYLVRSDLIPITKYAMEIPVKDITYSFIRDLDLLAPYGEENQAPHFMLRNVQILDIRACGKDGKHLKLKVAQDNKNLDIVSWGNGSLVETFNVGDKINVVGTLEFNSWQGKTTIQMKADDFDAVEIGMEEHLNEVMNDTLLFEIPCPVKENQGLFLLRNEDFNKVKVMAFEDDNSPYCVGHLTPKLAAKIGNMTRKYKNISYKVTVQDVYDYEDEHKATILIKPVANIR